MNNELELLSDENKRIWQMLATKIFLTDNDKVLTIGIHSIPKSINNVKDITSLSEEVSTSKYNLIVSNSVLSSQSHGDTDNIYSYDLHFKTIEQLLDNDTPSIYAMWHPITNKDDAVLNTLISTLDDNHVRFPRAEEIISAGTSYLILNEYLRVNIQQVYSFSDKNILSIINNHISNTPDSLLDTINPIVNTPSKSENNIEYGDFKYNIKLNVQAGLFMWSNY